MFSTNLDFTEQFWCKIFWIKKNLVVAGFLSEQGPFRANEKGALDLNPYAWNKVRSDLTQSVFKVVLQKSTPLQIRQLILD